jgi:hypothetical protein
MGLDADGRGSLKSCFSLMGGRCDRRERSEPPDATFDFQPWPVRPFFSEQNPGFGKERTLSSIKKGFSVRLINSLSGAILVVQQNFQISSAPVGPGIDSQQSVLGFIGPGVTVSGPVVHQEQDSSQGQAFTSCRECLGFCVDPAVLP